MEEMDFDKYRLMGRWIYMFINYWVNLDRYHIMGMFR